jgi:hypothetical protein
MTDDDHEQREKRTKDLLSENIRRATELRSKDREFHGLDREFLYIKAEILAAYNKSKDVKHPRDVGDTREQILRRFLIESGYLPNRYAVSVDRARVVSTSGHLTGEMDIVLYDRQDSIRLMNRENVYSVYPIESVYGVIQVKSRLNRKEIRDGLENVAAFKALDKEAESLGPWRLVNGTKSHRGFGILFAYDSDLDWLAISSEIKNVTTSLPQRQWCNAVFVASKGLFLMGETGMVHVENDKIEGIRELQIHGRPDRDDTGFYTFYSIIMMLLRSTGIQPTNPDSYFRLPFITGEHSYEFVMGAVSEMGKCPKHGDWQRKIDAPSLTKIVEYCRKAEPINWIKAIDIAYGRPGDNQSAYDRQPGDVRIYNPDNLPLKDILVINDEQGVEVLAFDQIKTAGLLVFLPYYYSIKEGLVSNCPKCGPIVIPTGNQQS